MSEAAGPFQHHDYQWQVEAATADGWSLRLELPDRAAFRRAAAWYADLWESGTPVEMHDARGGTVRGVIATRLADPDGRVLRLRLRAGAG